MKIRDAKSSDARAISELIAYYAEEDRMLFRPVSEVYENLQGFIVAADGAEVVGCVMLSVIWSDLAEIKSLAVAGGYKGKGIGKRLVEAAVEKARELELKRVFALTLEAEFFKKAGFGVIGMDELPMKVWSDCAQCPKQDHCDEIAVLMKL